MGVSPADDCYMVFERGGSFKLVGPDIVSRAIAFSPYRDSVAGPIKCNLRFDCNPRIVVFYQGRRVPAADGRPGVRPDVGVPPHCDGVALVIECDLLIAGTSVAGVLDERRRTPAIVWRVGIGHGTVPCANTEALAPYGNHIAHAVDRNLRIERVSCVVGFDEFFRAPAGGLRPVIGPYIEPGAITAGPYDGRVVVAVNNDLRVK